MLKLCSVRDSFKDFDEVWYIVRKPGNIRRNAAHKHVPLLSPSPNLFYWYREQHARGLWNATTFAEGYVPRFLEQMKGAEEQALLAELVTLSRSKNIALVCFCANEALCHRSIVGGILQNMGAEFAPNSPDYRKYKL